jgi:hypothetical protein
MKSRRDFIAKKKIQYCVLLTIFFLGDISCNKSQDLKHNPKLFEIISLAKSHFSDKKRDYTKNAIYDSFDFFSLKPSNHLNTTGNYVKLFYNEHNEIVKVFKAEKLEDSDFEFSFIQDSPYTIFFAEQIYDTEFENEQDDPINGFFLVYGDRCYFLSFQEPFCIMELDRDLKAIQTLKFRSNKLLYKTKVNYKNEYHLYSDTFYSPDTPYQLTGETLFSDIIEQFSSRKFTFDRELKIGWLKEQDHLPLWIFWGLHEYDVVTKP